MHGSTSHVILALFLVHVVIARTAEKFFNLGVLRSHHSLERLSIRGDHLFLAKFWRKIRAILEKESTGCYLRQVVTCDEFEVLIYDLCHRTMSTSNDKVELIGEESGKWFWSGTYSTSFFRNEIISFLF